MTVDSPSGGGQLDALPSTLRVRVDAGVARITLSRPAKRNALDDATVLGLETFFRTLPELVKVVILDSEGDHFCAGLDLAELTERDTLAGVAHSRMWHRAFESIESGTVPVIAVLKGAVVGGGLELATSTHLRVAERSTFYALPEGQRGLFVGGGGSVRIPRLIGTSRMVDLMLTGRRYDASEGHAAGLSHYLVEEGTGLAAAEALAVRIAGNAPQTNFAVLHALPLIAEANPREGFLMESLMAAIAQGTDDAKGRMGEFLGGRAGKVTDA
jgi:enoyl-CoA hydratase/carnithine racemase